MLNHAYILLTGEPALGQRSMAGYEIIIFLDAYSIQYLYMFNEVQNVIKVHIKYGVIEIIYAAIVQRAIKCV